MRKLLSYTIIFTLGVCGAAYAQQAKDFAGDWIIDATRSESAANAALPDRPFKQLIEATGDGVRIQTTRGTHMEDVTYLLNAQPKPDQPVGTSGTSIAHWNDGKLVTEMTRLVNGKAVVVRETRHLDKSNREMVVETSVEVEHGYETNGDKEHGSASTTFKDVYIRAN